MRLKALLISLVILLVSIGSISPSYAEVRDTNVDFISQIGILEGIDTENMSVNVTRAQFTAMLVRALNCDYSFYTSYDFSDVTADTQFSKEIYAAKCLKIVSGTGDGLFSPEKNITFAAAVKMSISVLGYEEEALARGGYPSGYMLIANKLWLTSGVSGANDDTLTLSAAVKLIYNTLKTDLNFITGVENNSATYSSEIGKNLLTENFRLSMVSGVVQSAGYLSMIPGFKFKMYGIDVNGIVVKTDRKDIEKYLGLYCTIWYNSENMTLSAVEIGRQNRIYEFDADDVGGFSGRKLEIYENNNTKSYTIDGDCSFVENGRAVSALGNNFVFDSGKVTLIDNDSDGSADVLITTKYEYFVVNGISNDTLSVYDKNLRPRSVRFNNTAPYAYEVLIYNFETDEYDTADFTSLEAGMVLMVSENYDKSLTRCIASRKKVSGTVSEYDDNNLVIDGISYEKNSYFKANDKYTTIGLEANFLMAADNTVTCVDTFVSNGEKYGYFLDMGPGNLDLSRKNKIKILTAEGKIEVFALKKHIKFDGKQPVDTTTIGFKNEFMNGDIPIYQLIKYALDENGEISSIDTAEDVSSKDDLYVKYEGGMGGENTLKKHLSKTKVYFSNGFGAPYFDAQKAIAFEVPASLRTEEAGEVRYDDVMFAVISSSSLDGDMYVDAYDYSDDFSAGAFAVYKAKATNGASVRYKSPGSSAESYITERITSAIGKDGGETVRLYLLGASGYRDYIVSEEYYDLLSSTSRIPESGDIIRIVLNSENEITSVARDVKFKDGALTVGYGVDGVREQSVNVFSYVTGKVFSKGNRGFSLITDNYPSVTAPMGNDKVTSYRFGTSNVVAIIYDAKTGQAKRASISDIVDAKSVGSDNASYLCARINYLVTQIVFIYVNQEVQND